VKIREYILFIISGYNDLKSELNEYLKKFAENKKVWKLYIEDKIDK
jgi:hypothetical protein